jgi:hypothetical protein
MEPAAAFAPCGFHLVNWTVGEEPGAQFWTPAGLPVESASINIFDSYSQESGGGHQHLVEYYALSATQHDPIEKVAQESFEVALHNMEMEIYSNPINVFKEVAHEFEDDIEMMKVKIHRYPASIRALGDWCTVPSNVSIGPYHHGREHLKKMEQAKHVAAYHCIRESGC